MKTETHTLTLSAGRHSRYDTPMIVPLAQKLAGHSQAKLTEIDTDRSIPVSSSTAARRSLSFCRASARGKNAGSHWNSEQKARATAA